MCIRDRPKNEPANSAPRPDVNSSALVVAAAAIGLLVPVAIRRSLLSGIRGFFAAGLGLGYGSVALLLLVWRGDAESVVRGAIGFAAVAWLLAVGGVLHTLLRHEAAFKQTVRETTVLQRLLGHSPRVLPAFSIDLRWLVAGLINTGIALVVTVLGFRQFVFIWSIILIGAFMLLASAGGFSGASEESKP